MVLEHDAPDLETTLPATVAGRPLVRWSVAGENFWKVIGGNGARLELAPEFAALGLSPDDIEMAVAGRQDTRRDPPYIAWVLRLGDLKGTALEGTLPSSIAMDVMNVDVNQGENWHEVRVAGRRVLVGNRAMVRQGRHQRGLPRVCFTNTAIYAVIADDDAWSDEVIRALPAE